MAIPEPKLKTWSRQGAVTTAKATHESIRKALNSHEWPRGVEFEAYLQGSYKNHTNIRGDSDVDMVVQLNSSFYYDQSALSEDERVLFKQMTPDATYLWVHFRADVLQALREYYDASTISQGNKSLKVAGGSGRLPADIVVCLQHRKYQRFRSGQDQSYVEGMKFCALDEPRWVINFPKIHYRNGVDKNAQQRTDGWYKSTVRVFKNARTYLVDQGIIAEDLAPSYFLECLIYNVADEQFGSSYQNTFLAVLKWLAEADFDHLVCQNEQMLLFGDTPEQWSEYEAVQLMKALMELWTGW